MSKTVPTSFDVQIYGDLTPYELNPSMSKARVSVFRKYGNMNGSYFTDEMAEQMVQGVAGSPIIGKYDPNAKDFTSHLTVGDTKAYGFIPPENPNFAWERRVENDGKEYDYACFDIVLWTDRYEEARTIPTKGQSMELNPRTIEGTWEERDGELVYVYSRATIYGLCVLGDNVRPCFDGACFYELTDNVDTYLNAMREEIKANFSLIRDPNNNNDKGGKDLMQFNMNLPQENLYAVLFAHLNPANEEGYSVISNVIFSLASGENGSGIAYYMNIDDKSYHALNFTCGSEIDENGEEVTTYEYHDSTEIADVMVFESADAANDIRTMIDAGHTYSAMQSEIETLRTSAETDKSNYESRINELETKLSGYEQREAEELAARKNEVIESYAGMVDDTVLTEVRENRDTFSLDQIESKLAVNFARSMQGGHGYVPTPQPRNEDPMLALLNSHLRKKKGE